MKRLSSYLLIIFLLLIVSWIWINKVNDLVTRDSIKEQNLAVQVQKAFEPVKDIFVMVKTIEPPVKVKRRRVKEKKVFKNKVVEKKELENGEFEPNLFADYEMPVSEYVSYMTSRGAKVFVYDKFRSRFVCEVLDNGLLMSSSGIKGKSSNLRRMTDDFPKGSEILNRVNKHFGWGNYEIILAMPDYLYNYLRNNIHRAVSEKGLDARDIVTVFITYKGDSSSLLVYVVEVSGNFGIRKIGKHFRL